MRTYDRETGASAYDPDGKAEKRPDEQPENFLAYTAVLAAIMLSVGMIAAAYTQSNRIDTLEHRIEYDRTREVERFDHSSEMRAENLHLISRQMGLLDKVALDHHRACQRAADLPPLPQVTVGDRATAPKMKGLRHIDHRSIVKRGAIDFYGNVRFFGDVEFIPEEE